MNKKDLSAYMSKIGTVGGKKSRRELSPEQAREMQRLSALARKAGSAPKKKRAKK